MVEELQGMDSFLFIYFEIRLLKFFLWCSGWEEERERGGTGVRLLEFREETKVGWSGESTAFSFEDNL